MPFKSKAQMRKFFSMEGNGELPKGKAEEWAGETRNLAKLPEHLARGGEVHPAYGISHGGTAHVDSRSKRYESLVDDTCPHCGQGMPGFAQGGEVPFEYEPEGEDPGLPFSARSTDDGEDDDEDENEGPSFSFFRALRGHR